VEVAAVELYHECLTLGLRSTVSDHAFGPLQLSDEIIVAPHALLHQVALCDRFVDYVLGRPPCRTRSDPRRRRLRAQRGLQVRLCPYRRRHGQYDQRCTDSSELWELRYLWSLTVCGDGEMALVDVYPPQKFFRTHPRRVVQEATAETVGAHEHDMILIDSNPSGTTR